ncbi:hypothetical protein [Paenibacillus flagellatus]|uniref:Uncharacterized protein n=1 Tax=Paenibacillus flagellatus TaxID=2211139 RepID=A0A2V5KEA8_9BACL|nr:hypothetical protein [Paenibacillus flagellatus]PYI57402.1 hypothetical protein DLM86_02895 [Paenibacillus flagellatus]
MPLIRMLGRVSLFRRTGFKQKMFLYMLLTSTVPVLLLGFAASSIASRTVQAEVDRNHQIILRQMQYQIDDMVKRLDQAAVQLANNILIENAVKRGPSLQHNGEALNMAETILRQRNFSDLGIHIYLFFSTTTKSSPRKTG